MEMTLLQVIPTKIQSVFSLPGLGPLHPFSEPFTETQPCGIHMAPRHLCGAGRVSLPDLWALCTAGQALCNAGQAK